MTAESVYKIWRPVNSPWSPWVKPVLFYFNTYETVTGYSRETWQVTFATDATVILDLPGADGVLLGMALCRQGYRPIPVYNASPFTIHSSALPSEQVDLPPAVDMLPIMFAISGSAPELAAISLPPSAPPVFLVDANRGGWTKLPAWGWFDNRSFITPSDFPSAEFFRKHGIVQVIVVRQAKSRMNADLREVLFALQKDGMAISLQEPRELWKPRFVTIDGPMLLTRLWHWLLYKTYSRDPSGTFGRPVSGPSNS